ncbi:MAG TPA: DNA internalization-related competence protein ComEC/Rec2 [Thermodesulfobacteriota bacterium]
MNFLSKHKILPPLFGFISGILITEWIGNEWILIALVSPIVGMVSLIKPKFGFLIFIPIGILFSARPDPMENHILRFAEKEIDLEGVLFKSPENREKGSRLFIDAKSVFIEGKENRTFGKVIITTRERIKGHAYGDRVRVLDIKLRSLKNFSNPGSFDIKRYYERQGVYATGFAAGEEWVISFGKNSSSNLFIHSLDKMRLKFGDFVRKSSPFPEGEIINAITIGDQGGIPGELRNEFSKAGIAHLFSISGLHVGAVALVFYVITKWLIKRSEFMLLKFQVPRLTARLTILPIFIYTILAGFATPVVRASIMAILYLISIVIGKEENKLNTLAVSAFIILLWQPWALFELSFQLSFASVLGILLMHKVYPFKVNTIRDKLFTSVKTTCAASIATLPFIINSFGVFPVVSAPANLIFVPFVEFVIVPLGLLSFLGFLLSENIATPILNINIFLIKLLLWGTHKLLQIPFSSLTIPSLGAVSWTLYGLALAVFLLKRTYARLGIIFPVLVLGFFGASAYSFLMRPNEGLLEMNFLDAGDRNIIFMRLPREKNVLVDGGFSYYDRDGFIERSVVTPFLLASGITKIDFLILTSLDKDHLKGVKELLVRFRVERLWTNGGKLNGELWEIIKSKGIRWKNIFEEVENFELEGVRFEFLKPRGKFEIKDSSRPYPILAKLSFKEANFLFGEAIEEESVQNELIEIYQDRIKSSLLYTPRIAGMTANFISVVSPRVIVTNTAKATLLVPNDIKKADIQTTVFQTGTQGTVTVLTDGRILRVKAYLDEKEQFLH